MRKTLGAGQVDEVQGRSQTIDFVVTEALFCVDVNDEDSVRPEKTEK